MKILRGQLFLLALSLSLAACHRPVLEIGSDDHGDGGGDASAYDDGAPVEPNELMIQTAFYDAEDDPPLDLRLAFSEQGALCPYLQGKFPDGHLCATADTVYFWLVPPAPGTYTVGEGIVAALSRYAEDAPDAGALCAWDYGTAGTITLTGEGDDPIAWSGSFSVLFEGMEVSAAFQSLAHCPASLPK